MLFALLLLLHCCHIPAFSKSWRLKQSHVPVSQGCADGKPQACWLECSYFNIPGDVSKGNIFCEQGLWRNTDLEWNPGFAPVISISLSFLFCKIGATALPSRLLWGLKHLAHAQKAHVGIHWMVTMLIIYTILNILIHLPQNITI